MGSGEVDGSREKGLAVNTDGIIIWDSIVQWKTSRRWFWKEKKERSFSGEDNIWRGRSLSPPHVLWDLFVSGGFAQAMGESCEGNTDINLP